MREREREREGERMRGIILIHRVIKIIFFFFFLLLMNSAHLFLDVHCSSGAKTFRFSSTAGASF